jgi:hypothetical protein
MEKKEIAREKAKRAYFRIGNEVTKVAGAAKGARGGG